MSQNYFLWFGRPRMEISCRFRIYIYNYLFDIPTPFLHFWGPFQSQTKFGARFSTFNNGSGVFDIVLKDIYQQQPNPDDLQ